MDAYSFSSYNQLIAGILLITVGLLGGGSVHMALQDIWIIITLSIFTAANYILWILLLKYNDMSKMSAWTMLIPIFGLIASYIYLNEDIFKIQNLIAITLTSCGIYLISLSCRIQNKKNQNLQNIKKA